MPQPKSAKATRETPSARMPSARTSPSARTRGRPPKEGALSGAERARRYREKQKAAGLIKRYVVTDNNEPRLAEDLDYWIANNKRIGELLSQANSERDYLKGEVERLHRENDSLLARSKEAERYSAIKEKELIVARQQASRTQDALPSPLPLPITKLPPSPRRALPVTAEEKTVSLPRIPAKTPESIVRDLKQSEKILLRKRAQIEKLENEAAAIEKGFRETVAACKNL